MKRVILLITIFLAAPANAGAASEDFTKSLHFSHWAWVEAPAKVRIQPNVSSRARGKLTLRTGDRTANLVQVLDERIVADRYWTQVRTYFRGSQMGWVRSNVLSTPQRNNSWVVVNKRNFTLKLFKQGKVVFSTSVGVGKSQWPTPKGDFYVRTRLTRFNNPIYGPIAFGLSARSEVLTDWPGGGFIGIHGTNQPGLLPGRVSHGCIRVRNRRIIKLSRLMKLGTAVTIR